MRRDLWTRTRAVVALVGLCLLTRCGQPYSNEDLVFLAALPERTELEARVPQQDGTARAGLSGRREAQGVGDVSQLYLNTTTAAQQFNDFLAFILGLVDGVRQVPATTREDERRVWGPFPWERQPTFEGRVVIARQAEGQFTWDIEFRRRDAPGAPWHTFLHGTARTRSELRSSTGTVHFPVKDIVATGMAMGGFESLEQLDFSYDLTSDPVRVDLDAAGLSGDRIGFASRRFADGSGLLTFDLRQEWVAGPAGQDRGRITTRWQADGRGRADVTILEGDGAGAEADECWGTDFRVTYQVQRWPFGAEVGNPASCIPEG